MNVFTGVGRLVRDAEIRYTRDGNAVLRGRIAIDRGMSKEQREAAQKNGEPTADFVDIVVFGKQAEAVAAYATKGKLIGVTGELRIRPWDGQDGQRRVAVEIWVRRLQLLGGAGNGANGSSASQAAQETAGEEPEAPAAVEDEDLSVPF